MRRLGLVAGTVRGYPRRVSARTRVTAVVSAAAFVAAGAVIGVTLLQTRGEETAAATAAVTKPQKGDPPLLLDLGVRTDPEAAAIRRALGLYRAGKLVAAARIFSRYHSLDARIGAAFADWPRSTLDRMKELAAGAPDSSTAELHLGLAEYWAGRVADATASWRRAAAVQPDSSAAVHAQDLLHPNMPIPGLPPFVPSFAAPKGLDALPPAKRLAVLARDARGGDERAKLLYGVALQQLGRPVSAERQFAAAARLAPSDPDARVAAAVGRFSKDHPERAFSRLGPLTRTFPHAQTVRFHLGLLLLWLREIPQARRQLRLAAASDPSSPLGREARAFLLRLAGTGTK
jgi:tetratricopeptide (TPR) repeat protein